MSQRIDLNRKVYDKNKYQKTIDTTFNELLPPPPPEEEIQIITVGEFFDIYENLFYDIPKTGETNSHEYLIKQSSEYIGSEATDSEIEALLNEINNLRTELLETQQELANAQQELANNING